MELPRDVADVYGTAPTTASGPRASRAPHPHAALIVPKHGGRQPLLADELQDLFRRRLRGVALYSFVGFCMALLLATLPYAPWFHRDYLSFIMLYVAALLIGALVLLLYSSWPHSLSRLRLLEVLLVATVSAQLAVELYSASMHVEPPNAPRAANSTVFAVMGTNHILRWFALIAAYGLYIPNTGRYATWLVLGTAAVPFLVLVLIAIQDEAARPLILGDVMWRTFFWMGCAVALSLYGSHKLRILRQEAFEARQLGQYHIERLIGQGGAGAVYLANHPRLRRPCAVKIIRPDKLTQAAQRRFEHEVQALAELDHPNCVEIFDYGRANDGSLYYVMEFLVGMTLWDLVDKHGPLPAGRAIWLLRQVGAALSAAHGRGLVHRDVKPNNIFLCFRKGLGDVAKLLDFGLAQVDPGWNLDDGRVTQEGNTVGTPSFMSPEQIVAKDRLDGRSDLYSLGVTGYFLLTGKLPFERGNVFDIFSAHLHEAPMPLTQINDNVPVDLQEVILHCLEKKPDDRFPDADTLIHALAACRDAAVWNAELSSSWWQRQ